jgi:cyclohexadieny/prephenate dehydrogenase
VHPDASERRQSNAVDNLCAFWAALGAKVEIMTPRHHDLVLAVTSHLPQLIAYMIVGTADELAQVTSSEVVKFLSAASVTSPASPPPT